MESGKQSVTAFEYPENRALRQTWIFGSGSRYAIRPCCDLTHASPRPTRPAHTPISHCSRQVFAVAVTEGFRQPFHSSAHSGRLTIRSVTSAYPSPTEGSYPESAAAGALGNTNTATAFHALGSDHISGSHYQDREEEFDRQRGQWSGPRDHRRAGDQDPMSQKGPASGSTSPAPQQQLPQKSPTATNTASRVCSVSPRNLEEAARRAESSAVAAAASDAAAALETQHLYHRPRHSLGTPTTNGERVHHSPQRSSLGVHHILNPAATEPRSGSPGPGTPTSAVARSIEDERLGGRYNPAVSSQQGSNPSTPQLYTPRPYGLAGPPQQQQQSQQQQQQQQQHQQSENSSNMATLGSMLHHRSLSTGRQSPASSPSMHPFPSMGAATRRILTPQSPRALSMGGGRGPPPPNRPLISSPAPLLHHQPPPPPPSSAAPSPCTAKPPPHNVPTTRALSQPAAGLQSPSDNRQQQHQFHGPQPPYPGTYQYNHPGAYPPPGSSHGGEHRYSSSHSSYGGGSSPRAIPVPEGQLAFRIAPVNGEVFTIPVDTHQASRASDEKRQRNAGASARFRLRKKEREQQQVMNLQKLQQDNAEMQKRLQELEEIEIERNRLRDIVWRTQQSGGPAGSTATSEPSGYHHQRQPSPPRRRHAESLSVGGVPPPPPIPSGAYGAGDPVTGERPSRRRRTDSGLEFAPVPPPSQHHQAQGPPHALPSPLSYAGAPLSQPGTPTGLRPTTRLPPLRMDHQSSEAQHRPPSEPGSATTQQSQQGYSPYKREPYESGWAVRPGGGGPHDPNQKGA
ncbi:hypothetical protein PG997_002351 [Apiospora hydei]|uniref:BZIP domain-containing protein n=1 Tax=Apiospora hydei TaxID=1337664 RepID=A0ABR1X952_9PEZI